MVQVYLKDVEASFEVPYNTLVAFKRVTLDPGQTIELAFTIEPEMMMLYDDDGKPMLEHGEFQITIGGCSPSPRGLQLGAPQPVNAYLTVQ